MTGLKPTKQLLWLIIIGVTLWISGFFVASQPITPQMAIISSISVVLFALPSYWAVVRLQGRRQGTIILVALGVFALALESIALTTGFPYGQFTYTEFLASKVLDLTPWTVAFAYPPLVLLAYAISRYVSDKFNLALTAWKLIVVTAIIATLCDIVLDPAAVRLNFWYWDQPGFFHGVPLINFAGWLFSSSLAAMILHGLWRSRPVTPALLYSGMAVVWFWTCVNGWFGHWLPTLVGVALSVGCIALLRSEQGTIRL